MSNLEHIKDVTKALLHVDPTPDDQLPWIIHHPVFEQSTVWDGEWFELIGNESRARAPYINIIDEATEIYQLLMLIRDPYKMLWFKMCAEYVDDPADYADILKTCWSMEEWPSRDVNVKIHEIVKLFKGADKSLMVGEIPETLKIYRGVNKGGSPYGLSWTTNLEIAQWFASRFDCEGQVYTFEVPASAVLAKIEERGESEIVVDASKFKRKIELFEGKL